MFSVGVQSPGSRVSGRWGGTRSRAIAILTLCLILAAPANAACIGDCDGDGNVTIDEIIKGVGIALNIVPLQQCDALDTNRDGEVTVDEIIQAINNALNGCPPIPTATPPLPTPTTTTTATATPPPATPTTTATATVVATSTASPTSTATAQTTPQEGISVASRTTGLIQSTTNVLRVVPDILAALLGHLPTSNGAGGADIEIPFDCSAGGSGTFSCEQRIVPQPGPPVYTIAFSECMILSSGGAIVSVQGAVSVTGNQDDLCTTIPSMAALRIDNLSIEVESDRGTTDAIFTNLSAQASLSCAAGECSCTYDTVGLDMAGTVRVTAKDAVGNTLSSTEALFGSGSSLVTSVQTFDSECVPQVYQLRTNGSVDFATDGTSYSVSFDDYLLQVDATSGEDLIDISGRIASTCLNGMVALQTRTLLRLDRGATCPAEGQVIVSHPANDLVRYLDPGVEIDLGDDGSVDQPFPSCLDPRLLVCPLG